MVDWILSYSAYIPSDAVEAKRDYFRNGVIDLTNENIEQYLHYLSQYEIELSEVQKAAKEGKARPLEIVVDFDTKTFVNGFREINLDHYVPKRWEAYEDDPYEYVPKAIGNLWRVAE